MVYSLNLFMKIILLKFFILSLLFLLLSEIANYYLNIDNLLINSFSDKFTTEQLNSFLFLQDPKPLMPLRSDKQDRWVCGME